MRHLRFEKEEVDRELLQKLGCKAKPRLFRRIGNQAMEIEFETDVSAADVAKLDGYFKAKGWKRSTK